jgi:hypothetical protein
MGPHHKVPAIPEAQLTFRIRVWMFLNPLAMAHRSRTWPVASSCDHCRANNWPLEHFDNITQTG